MSNQLVITSGAKVRSLEGVLTGTSGVVNSVPLGGANGVATLDSSGKVPLSQLPASVITYLGTWNAATNTPTLVNGVGDVGDLYICNVAGTVNFGAGPITFAVGDWVIYSGTTWEKSGGASGTVTSVAMTVPTGLSVTGSPITTSGTLAVSLASGYTIPTTSFLSGLVPYTGATQTVDLGAYDLNARGIKINGTGGLGHADFKHQSGTPTGSASSSTLYANTDGNIAWLNDHSHTITLAADANTADRTYTFPDASGTIALTSSLSSYVPYTGATTDVNLGSHSLTASDVIAGGVSAGYLYGETSIGGAGYLFLKGNGAFGTLSIYNSIFANGYKYGFDVQGGTSGSAKRAYLDFGSLTNSTTRTYTFPDASGTIALTSSLTNYVPYTGATSQVDLGSNNLYGKSLNVWGDGTNGGGLNLKQYTSQSFLAGYGYTALYTDTSYGFGIWFLNGASTSRQINFNASLLANNTGQTYYLPAATGTLALTSDIPSLTNYVTTNTNQTITGIKTFSNEQLFGNGMTLTGGYITYTSGSYNLTLNTNILTANRNVFLQDKAGTIALTSDLTGGTVTSVGLSSSTSGVTIGSSPITTSGTITLAIATASGSQQGLLSSTDWTTFNNKQNALTNPITGTGTTNTHAKFTGSTTLGNSMLSDDGTTLTSAGATRSNLYLKATSNSYYSQLAFTNGTNGSFGGLSYNNSGQYMQFETNSSEWARLNSNGNFLIGTTSDNGSKLQVSGAATFSSNLAIGGESNIYGGLSGLYAIQNGNASFYSYAQEAGIIGNAYYNSGWKYKTSNLATRYIANVGTHTFQYAPTGTADAALTWSTGMYIGSTGNVGIGTSSPSALLDVYLSSVGTYFRGGSDNVARQLRIFSSTTTNPGDTHTFDAQSGTGNLVFQTTSTERMRITSGGQVYVGVTSGLNGTLNSATLSGQFALSLYDGFGNNAMVTIRNSSNAQVGSITIVSGSTATAYNTTSDYRLKEDFKEIKGLEKVSAIKVYDFKWKSGNYRMDGVIAHELAEVLPYAVVGEKDGEDMQGVDYSKIVPVLVKAIQEQQAQIEELKALINK